MVTNRRIRRVRTPAGVFKILDRGRSPWAGLAGLALLLAGLIPACQVAPRVRMVSLESLESASPRRIHGAQRHLVRDGAGLQALAIQLGPRLGLIEVRNEAQWQALNAAVGGHMRRPDFSRGTLVGLATWAGTPVDGEWPVELQSVHLSDGGGLLRSHFHGGTYLPDGTAYLETAYVPDLRAVLVVDIDGTSFYPDELR